MEQRAPRGTGGAPGRRRGSGVMRRWRALELFTDRYEQTRRFIEYLQSEPPLGTLLFFHGDGGHGKTLLIDFLRKKCCKLLSPDNWAYVSALPDAEMVAEVEQAQGAEEVPNALLDFGIQPGGFNRPQEAFYGLLALRKSLAGHGIAFPLYDYANLVYLSKTNQLTDAHLQSLYPEEELDFALLLADMLGWSPLSPIANIARGVANIASKRTRLREWRTERSKRRPLGKEDLADIDQMDAERELLPELPGLFAEDLNTSMALRSPGKPKRIALFFDTYEVLLRGGDEAKRPYSQGDTWVRYLLDTLDLELGIVVVLAGREVPTWARHGIAEIEDVSYFDRAAAHEYLLRSGIDSQELRDAIIAYVDDGAHRGNVHPFYLVLCADVVLEAEQRGIKLGPDDFQQGTGMAEREDRLVQRLLSYVDYEVKRAVEALSACRAFNWEIYSMLGRRLDFQCTRPAFERLVGFSFVWREDGRGREWYRIHELVRRVFRKQENEVTRQADEALEEYYRNARR